MRAATLLAVVALLPLAAGQDVKASHDPRNLTWVERGVLAVGGGGLNASDVDWLQEAGFGAIVDLRAEHHDPQAYIEGLDMRYLRIPIDSATDINETQLQTFIAWTREQQAAGRVVYVHCSNGWHRAAAFATAWEIAADGRTYDQASADLIGRRPGVVMRATGALLDLEASLQHASRLAVTLGAPQERPSENGSMVAMVHVETEGRPVVGASVDVWSEEMQLWSRGTTTAEGTFSFAYPDPSPHPFMDHVHARASLAGHLDGADVAELYYDHPAASRGALSLTASRVNDAIVARATLGGAPVPVRFVMDAPGVTQVEASAVGSATFADLPAGDITVRATAWGADDAIVTLRAPSPPPSPSPPGASIGGSAAIDHAIPSSGLGLAIAALAVGLYTPRPGSRGR